MTEVIRAKHILTIVLATFAASLTYLASIEHDRAKSFVPKASHEQARQMNGPHSQLPPLEATASERAPATASQVKARPAVTDAPRPWTHWARLVGQSESERTIAIQNLKREKNLSARLLQALYTSNRPLALDVIGALEMKSLVPELLLRVGADADGAITLSINSLLDGANQVSVLTAYAENVRPETISRFSASTIVAMLEPLGRLGTVLPKSTLKGLLSHSFPEVKAAVLYYIRMLTLHFGKSEHDLLIKEMLKAGEFQLRLQAISILGEIAQKSHSSAASGATSGKNSPAKLTTTELHALCNAEASDVIKGYCFTLLRRTKEAK